MQLGTSTDRFAGIKVIIVGIVLWSESRAKLQVIPYNDLKLPDGQLITPELSEPIQ